MRPLQLLIVFHPDSEETREIARAVHLALNEDPTVPGLRIPTRFVMEEEDGEFKFLPPIGTELLEEAEHTFVMVLADDKLNAGHEGDLPQGRKDWGEWVADVYEACTANPTRRCVPVQISESAHPLDKRLSSINFPRAWRVEPDNRVDWIVQRVVIELIRFLEQEALIGGDQPPQVPLQLFLSHTKADLVPQSPKPQVKVVEDLHNYLRQDHPVNAWVDSGDIEGGAKFGEAIAHGVKNSALLSVLTDSYSSRTWCRKEVLLTKEFQRPVVVVDALQTQEVRSFPYMGNVPVLHWNGDPKAAVDLLFRERLRHLHTQMVLTQAKEDGDEILSSAPELSVLVGNSGKTFLYPDPPLGEEELSLLSKSGAKVETPLQRFAKNQPLANRKIALSLSESSELRHYGFDIKHFDQIAIEISRYLLLAGATLCYGGHLGKQGYTQALFELVRSYPVQSIRPDERIINFVGWPQPLTTKQRSDYKDCAHFERLPRPSKLSELDAPEFLDRIEHSEQSFPADRSPLHHYAWALGMTEMREKQTSQVQARIALGGKIGPTLTSTPTGDRKEKWYSSRIPGVLEEILISLQHSQPVYLLGGLGGCARMVADLLLGRERAEMSWDFHKRAPHAEKLRQLYQERGEVGWWTYEEIVHFIKQQGIEGLRNGLNEEENRELFESTDCDRMVELLLRGLGKI
jgi:hypothetical protein